MAYKKFFLMVGMSLFFMTFSSGATVPETGIVEQLGKFIPLDLVFTDSSGARVTLRDVIKKPTVISPVYYHCPDICTPILEAETDALSGMDLVPGVDYQALTVSFDEMETPANSQPMKADMIRRFGRPFPPESWHFLTGDRESIKTLTDSLGFYFKRQGDDFLHPTALIMVSPQGKITRYIYGADYLPFDVKLGLLEASEGKVGPTVRRVLLYCFRYDSHGKRYVFDILKVTATVTLFFLFILVIWLVILTRRRSIRITKDNDNKER
ncbi:MAG: SCO family protein [Candidatus Omnitrophota bacterium]